MAHAEAYDDPGTPEEQSRRTFMANAVIAIGGVISIAMAIPLVTSLLPASESGTDVWSGLTPDQAASLKKATETTPVKVTFTVHESNAYFGAADAGSSWGCASSDGAVEEGASGTFTGPTSRTPGAGRCDGLHRLQPAVSAPRLRAISTTNRKEVSLPVSRVDLQHAGRPRRSPALRGLDPLPLRDFEGKVQVTWIEYAPTNPATSSSGRITETARTC